MRIKVVKTSLLIYLVVFFNIAEFCQSQSKPDLKGPKLVAACMSGLMQNIPPEFCWKKGADAGVIPTDCPSGYFRSLALCYENCRTGYYHVLGVCWARCAAGYTDHGATCFKNLFNFYFKSTYIPGSLTNFDSRVPCPKGMYRQGALCYRNCNNIGMENCGIGACSSSSDVCASSIAKMVLDVFQGLADAILFVISFGGSTGLVPAKNAVKNGVLKVGKQALKNSLNSLKKFFVSKFKAIRQKMAMKEVKQLVKKIDVGSILEADLEIFCNTVWQSAEQKVTSASDINTDTIINAVDIFGIGDIVSNCKDTKGEKNAIACASSVLSGLTTFDPTGLLTIANTFLKPTCVVTTDIVTDGARRRRRRLQDKQQQSDVADNCVILYEKCNYQGQSKTYCQDTTNLGDFKYKGKSIKAGSNINGYLFEQDNYNGLQFPLSPSLMIDCFDDYKKLGFDIQKLTGSIKLNTENCLIISYAEQNQQINNIIICQTTDDLELKNKLMNFVALKLLASANKKITLYSQPKFKGKTLVYDNLKNSYIKNDFPLETIASVKIE